MNWIKYSSCTSDQNKHGWCSSPSKCRCADQANSRLSRIDHPNAHFPPTEIEVLGGFGQLHYCQKCPNHWIQVFPPLLCTIKHLGCGVLLQTLVTEWECLTKYSTVTVITKWKWLGMTATKPQSARPHETTETEGQQKLWCAEATNFLQNSM